MFYRNSNDSKHLNIRIVSLAAGLALATATIIGASDLLKEEHNSNSTTSSVTPRVERIAPQFGSAADAVYASQGIRAPSQFTTEADAVYAMEGMVADVATVPNAAIDGRDQALGIGQPSVGQSFATQVDAVYAMEGMIAKFLCVVVAGCVTRLLASASRASGSLPSPGTPPSPSLTTACRPPSTPTSCPASASRRPARHREWRTLTTTSAWANRTRPAASTRSSAPWQTPTSPAANRRGKV